LKKNDFKSLLHIKPNHLVLYAVLLAVLATTFLTLIYFFYIPLHTDSGWYSYPALSLSRGGDPGENYAKVDDLKEIKGIKVIFNVYDDFRRSIRVLPITLWFKAFGTSLWIVKLYGIMEYLILLMMMFLVLRQMTTDRNILFLCFGIFILDSPTVWYGSTNLRPDILITALTLGVFLLARIEDRKDYRWLIFLAGVLGIFFLSLIRITCAVSLTFLLSYLLIELSVSWRSLSGFRKGFYLCLISAGIIGFVLQNQLLDMILSSKFSGVTAFQLEEKILKTMKHRISYLVFLKEQARWGSYFRFSNIGSFLVVLLAISLSLARRFFRIGETAKTQDRRIGLSCFFAVAVLVLFDPWGMAGHALPIVAFLFLLLARELELITRPWIRKLVFPLLLVIILCSSGIRMVQGINVTAKSIKYGFSNAAAVEAISHVFNSPGKKYLVFGAAELWPYFDPQRNVVIVDYRHNYTINRLAEYIKSVDYLIINKSYEEEDWGEKFLKRYPGIKLEPVVKVGIPMSGGYFLKIVRPVFPG
jgi:hypothetical protein